jgi:hypothetical protein
MVDTWSDHPGTDDLDPINEATETASPADAALDAAAPTGAAAVDAPEPGDAAVDAALRALRADVAPMAPHAFVAGRARLTAVIGTAAPAEPVTAPAEPVVVAALPAASRRSPPLRRAAPWLTAAAAVAAVATTVALLPGSSNSAPGGANPVQAAGSGAPRNAQPTSPPSPTAIPVPTGPLPAMPARPLNSAGDLAAVAADITLKPGEVLYVKSTQTDLPSAGSTGGSLTLQLWVPADRTHSYWLAKRSSTGDIKGAPAGGYSEQQAIGGKFEGNTYTGPPESPWSATPDNLAAMPRDPAALYAKLRADMNGPQVLPQDPTTNAVNTVFMLLSDEYAAVPAGLRAALLRTLGYLPGVTVTQGVHTTDGRPAVALSWQQAIALPWRFDLLLDPANARAIEYRVVATAGNRTFRAGQTMSSTIGTQSVVHALGQLP